MTPPVGAYEPRPSGPAPRGHLRARLVGLDLLGSVTAWTVVLGVAGSGSWASRLGRAVPDASAAGLLLVALLAVQKLYLARVCAVRAVELTRLARAAALCGVVMFSNIWPVRFRAPAAAAAAGAACSFAAVALLRSGYCGWLRACRARGRYCRAVCILGDNDEAEELVELFSGQPELGYRVVAVLGDPDRWNTRDTPAPAVDPGSDIAEAVRAVGASGVVVATSAYRRRDLDHLVRQLVAAGLHVHLSPMLSHVGHPRIRVSPLSHHLLFYVEGHSLSRRQMAMKRAMDLSVTLVGMTVALPLMAVAALAIKLDDGGPVLYRQERVGRDGRTFDVLKLRTMEVDAGARLAGLAAANERKGPLFKMRRDPRVTRVGRVLRPTSIDELPQLLNVLRGEMSLVGPRPALPSEAAQFDRELRERTSVLPGITGLWQVEAGDSPSFQAYRRLDLFYLDNWSVRLDIYILAATVGVLIRRALRLLVERDRAPAGDGAELTMAAVAVLPGGPAELASGEVLSPAPRRGSAEPTG